MFFMRIFIPDALPDDIVRDGNHSFLSTEIETVLYPLFFPVIFIPPP